MDTNLQAYSFALLANVIFAFSVQIFTHYSRKVSPIWMNYVKALVALLLFTGTILVMGLEFSFSSKVILLLFFFWFTRSGNWRFGAIDSFKRLRTRQGNGAGCISPYNYRYSFLFVF